MRKVLYSALVIAVVILFLAVRPGKDESICLGDRLKPTTPELLYSSWTTGPIDVALTFGQISGCREASHELIIEVSEAANRANLDPKLGAALVAVESRCDTLAISNRGAVGLTQVRPSVWKDKYDFQKVNLFNHCENLKVGFTILADLIRDNGAYEGIRRYQGTGPNGDPNYEDKILKLTGRVK